MAEDKQATLDAVNNAINAMLDGGAVQEYSINGRSIKKISLSELMQLRDRLQSEIAAGNGTRTYVEFQDPL